MSFIPVILEEEEMQKSAKSGTLSGGALASKSARYTIKQLDIGKLGQSMSHLATQISELLKDVKKVGDFQLQEVQFQIAISAEGGFVLVGKAGIEGAISLTFSNKS